MTVRKFKKLIAILALQEKYLRELAMLVKHG